MAPLSSFLFLLVLVYGIIASQNGFMTLNIVAEARALDVMPYGEVVKASSDRLGHFQLRKRGRPATPPPMASNPVHMLIPPAKPFRRPPPPPLPPAALGLPPPPPLLPPPPLPLSPPPPSPLLPLPPPTPYRS
ncbi:glycine-rich protein [Actinidia rufa]|uniref:Glycine-rich protein n=1 Tax=Actinidia rufa TaxID=165716 RepID=A0A7J0D990_9ERIC|nr:glycine-rich protein [Actinidia rufa]